MNLPLVELWKHRSLIVYFSLVTIKSRFRGSYLGFLWNGLEPLLVFLLLYTVFSSIRISQNENFGMYLLTGVLFYHIFTRGTLLGMNILKSNRGILQSININKELFIGVSITSTFISMLIEISAFFLVISFLNFTPGLTLVLLPLSLLSLLILILGFSYMLSVINIYVRDIQPIWAIIIQATFFITPIFWYISDVSNDILLKIHPINPIGQIIEIAHKLIVFNEYPPLIDWVYSFGLSISVLVIGFVIFKMFENRLVEEV